MDIHPKKNEIRHYWMICIPNHLGEWCDIRCLFTDREEAEARLQCRRQWRPEAFLVEARLIVRESQCQKLPLPLQTHTGQPEAPAVQSATDARRGLRLV